MKSLYRLLLSIMMAADVVNPKSYKNEPNSFLYLFFFFTLRPVAQKNIHAPWGQMLKAYVAPSGKVNYAEWKNESKKLGEYINTLAQMPPQKTWPKTQQLAYWINAYNALTIQLILKHYPLKSIKDLNKPWDKVVF